MKKIIISIFSILLIATTITKGQSLPVPAPSQDQPVILTGGTIHTATGEIIVNGVVTFVNGKITAVGKRDELNLSTDGFKVYDVTGKHIYPGLILTNSNLGLSEIGSVEETQDSRELGQINPGVRTIVAYNTDSHVIPVVRSNGILLAQIVPVGGLLSGTSSVVQLDAWNWEDAAYNIDQGVHLNWPRMSARTGRRRGFSMMPAQAVGSSSYDKSLKELDKLFSDAAAYAEVENHVRTNFKLEAVKGLFTGEQTLYLNVSEAKGIIASVNFAKEHGIQKIVLVGANEDAWMVKDFIKENNIPIILASIHSMPAYEHSDTRLPFKLAKMFYDEGILVGITFPGAASAYNLPFVAGTAAAYGLDKEVALQMITINNAKMLGIDNVTGSLEVGKDANIIVSTGDVLDMISNNIEHAFINGRLIDLDNKFKMLNRRFQEKYK